MDLLSTPLSPRAAGGSRTLERAAATIVVVGLVIGGVFIADGLRMSALDDAKSHYATSLRATEKATAAASTAVDDAERSIAAAQTTLDGSAGRVVGESERTALAAGIADATSKVAAAERELTVTRRSVSDLLPAPTPFGETFEVSAKKLRKIRFTASQPMTAGAASLGTSAESVTAAVAAWQAEQDRLAAVAAEEARVAAEHAAAEAAAAAKSAAQEAGARGGSSSRITAHGSATAEGTGYSKNVWTSGFQDEIDQCNGAVDVTARYGPTTIAEHWSCGGRSFPTSVGATVTITGQRAGVYRVEGIVATLDVSEDSAADVPYGYDLLYQTCINGSSANMSFTALTRIG